MDHPNCFGQLQIVFVESKPFCLGLNHFGQVQIRLLWTKFYNLDLTKMIWTHPKWIGPVLNHCYLTKMIWTVQNDFWIHRRTRHKYLCRKLVTSSSDGWYLRKFWAGNLNSCLSQLIKNVPVHCTTHSSTSSTSGLQMWWYCSSQVFGHSCSSWRNGGCWLLKRKQKLVKIQENRYNLFYQNVCCILYLFSM